MPITISRLLIFFFTHWKLSRPESAALSGYGPRAQQSYGVEASLLRPVLKSRIWHEKFPSAHKVDQWVKSIAKLRATYCLSKGPRQQPTNLNFPFHRCWPWNHTMCQQYYSTVELGTALPLETVTLWECYLWWYKKNRLKKKRKKKNTIQLKYHVKIRDILYVPSKKSFRRFR